MFSPENAGMLWMVTIVIAVAAFAFYIYLQWRIFTKAGFNGALALVNLGAIFPLIGPFIVLGLQVWFAFAEWPIHKQTQSAAPSPR